MGHRLIQRERQPTVASPTMTANGPEPASTRPPYLDVPAP